MREWSERHIRELIRNEIIRLGGVGGDGERPPMPYDEYWPGPVDLVTGGKLALFSIADAVQSGAIWPSCWLEFLGIHYVSESDLTVGRWFRFYWRQNSTTQDGDFIMSVGIPTCPEVTSLAWGDGVDQYPVWSEQHHLWRWRQGELAAAGPVANIYIDRLQSMINDTSVNNNMIRAVGSAQGTKNITMKVGTHDGISSLMVQGNTIDLYSVGTVRVGLHYIDCYYTI